MVELDDRYCDDTTEGVHDADARARRCELPQVPPRQFDAGIDPGRASSILVSEKKWVNGTVLRYHYMEETGAQDVDVVDAAFRQWKDLPIGLDFLPVVDPNEAEIRISFDHTDGSWSTVGRDALNRPSTMATMNFGWQLAGWSYGRDTALHEIGHAIGLPHEHQNPNAGIVWDEPAVIADFAGPPNNWDEGKTRWNILRKIAPDEVQGSEWDPDSIMHYSFDAGLILVPERFRTEPLTPAPNLSARDVEWVKTFYPATEEDGYDRLRPFESKWFELGPAEQVDLIVEVDATRTYTFSTFGESDTVLVLFEVVHTGPREGQGLRFRAGDDDSGTGDNSRFQVKLFKGKRYVVRLRVYWAGGVGITGLLMW